MKPRGSVSGSTPSRLRCAVYTRKSSEEGLEQSFNSLHAQREACEGWCQSDANSSPFGAMRPSSGISQAMRLCRSARAAARCRVLINGLDVEVEV